METLDSLKKQLYHTQQMLISANAHICELTDEQEKDKYRAEAASLRKDNYNLLNANIRLTQEKNDLQSELKLKTSLADKLIEANESLERKLTFVRTQFLDYRDKYSEALRRITKLKEGITDDDTNYKEKYENCQAYLKLMTNERNSLQNKLNISMETVKRYINVRDTVTNERDTLQKELNEAKSLIRSIRNCTDYYFSKQ